MSSFYFMRFSVVCFTLFFMTASWAEGRSFLSIDSSLFFPPSCVNLMGRLSTLSDGAQNLPFVFGPFVQVNKEKHRLYIFDNRRAFMVAFGRISHWQSHRLIQDDREWQTALYRPAKQAKITLNLEEIEVFNEAHDFWRRLHLIINNESLEMLVATEEQFWEQWIVPLLSQHPNEHIILFAKTK